MIESEFSNLIKNGTNASLIPTPEVYYLAESWKLKNFNKLLDLGCGFGRHSIYFAKRDFQVTAVDLSDYAINNIKEWAYKEKLHIDTNSCDMINLPFEDNTFDCIMAYNVIYYTDTQGFIEVLQEIERVLKSGGEAFITLLSKNTCEYKTIDNYGHVDDNTIIKNQVATEKNVPHFFVDINDINEYFKNFEFVINPIEKTEYNMNYTKQYSTNFNLIVKKNYI